MINKKIQDLNKEINKLSFICLNNPTKGTVKIIEIDSEKITTVRGKKNSRFYLYIDFLIAVYHEFKGKGKITVNDIQNFKKTKYNGKQTDSRCDYMLCIILFSKFFSIPIQKDGHNVYMIL